MTTAQLFAEALATLPVLLRAGAVWLVLLCGMAGLAVYAVVMAVVCACRGLWRGVVAVRSAVQASRAPALLSESPEPAETLSEQRVPSWAHTDTDNQTPITFGPCNEESDGGEQS